MLTARIITHYSQKYIYCDELKKDIFSESGERECAMRAREKMRATEALAVDTCCY